MLLHDLVYVAGVVGVDEAGGGEVLGSPALLLRPALLVLLPLNLVRQEVVRLAQPRPALLLGKATPTRQAAGGAGAVVATPLPPLLPGLALHDTLPAVSYNDGYLLVSSLVIMMSTEQCRYGLNTKLGVTAAAAVPASKR